MTKQYIVQYSTGRSQAVDTKEEMLAYLAQTLQDEKKIVIRLMKKAKEEKKDEVVEEASVPM